MGIEDFNLYSDEFANKILLISPSEKTREQIEKILKTRSYAVHTISSLEEFANIPTQEIWDLVIYHIEKETFELDEIELEVRHIARLSRASLAVLYNKTSRSTTPLAADSHQDDMPQFANVITIGLPVEPAHLLVKITTLLRLRKFHLEQAKVESDITAQNARLRDLTNRFKHELLQAQNIHYSILPKTLPKHQSCIFAASYVPLEAIGGDLFDIWQISTDTIGFFIADVTGHGLPAAFIGAMTKMALSYAPKTSPDGMLTHMAQGLTDHLPEGHFVTALAAIYNTSTKTLQLSRAGHPAPYLWEKQTQQVSTLSPKGLPLGVSKDAQYQLLQVKLHPGDKILMLTDGLTETQNMNGELLGNQGISRIFEEVAKQHNIAKCLSEIIEKQKEFSGNRILKDDCTLLGLEIIE